MKRLSKLVGASLLLLLGVLVARALWLQPAHLEESIHSAAEVDAEGLARRMSEAIRFETISWQAPRTIDPEPFEAFVAWTARTYPAVHRKLATERVGGYSLLHVWQGSDPSLDPILLTGHYDVVPVTPGSEGDWVHPPFAGVIDDGHVWGRGALDDKSAVVAMYEAVSLLLAKGFEPRRTIYFAFDHDEEIGGREGAGAVTELLQSRGVELAWSLDEGSFLIEDMMPGIEAPLASINVAEKGYVTLEMVAHGQGGHSSIPPRQTAAGVLAMAILALEANPMPGGVDGPMGEMLDAVAPHAPFGVRVVLANRWLFDGALALALSSSNAGNAMLRTTTAVTMLSASVKENVLPTEAVATVNFRLHPRDTVDDVVAHVERVIADDRVEVRRTAPGSAASHVASTQSEGFRDIAAAARDVVRDAIVMPGITVGGTDSRHFSKIARDSYRFNPMLVTAADTATFHGTNERISIDNLVRATQIYVRLIERAAGP